MANNNFTETFADGIALTQAMIETGLKTLTLDITNTSQMTAGSTSGTFLQSNGSGVAASFGSVPDPLGPFAIRNYGLSASASSGTLKVALKGNNGSDPSGSNVIDCPFSTNGSAAATYSNVQVKSALSITIPSSVSATLGFTATSTSRVFVYALNNAATPILGLSALSNLDNGAAVSTTALSSTSNSASTLYATASLSVVARLLGWVESAHNALGAWQSPTKVNVTNSSSLNDTGTVNHIVYDLPTRAVSGTVGKGGVAISNSSGAFSTSSTSSIQVTNLTAILTTTGRPVVVKVIPDGTAGNFSTVVANKSSANSTNLIETRWYIKRGSTIVAQAKFSLQQSNASTATFFSEIPTTVVNTVDTPTAGTYTYSVEVQVVNAAGKVDFNYAKLCVYEL